MAWFFTKTERPEPSPEGDTQLTLEALQFTLRVWLQDAHGARRERLERLLDRLDRPPLPTGLLRELRAVMPPETSAQEEENERQPYGDAMAAVAAAMRASALLDEGLVRHIDQIVQSIPATPDAADALKLCARADAVRRFAEPIRTRAAAERQELLQTASDLNAALRRGAAPSASLADGLDQLTQRLSQEYDPEGLRRLRLESLHSVSILRDEAEKLRASLRRARREAAVLEGIITQQSSQLREVQEAASLDTMTGLLNRGTFDDELLSAVREARLAQVPLALVLLDIDHFKRVNDTWGHPVGDAVIKGVSGRLRAAVRSRDSAARIGGEEFAILLPSTDAETAFGIAERVRLDIAARCFPGADEVEVTISLGVGELRGNEDANVFLRRVDQALYASKNAGRNRSSRA